MVRYVPILNVSTKRRLEIRKSTETSREQSDSALIFQDERLVVSNSSNEYLQHPFGNMF